MPFGRSDAGLECLSDCRASAVQRLRTFSRAQQVVSTIICWGSHSSDVGSDFGVKQGEFFAQQLPQAAHEPYRITVPSCAAVVLPSPSEFASSYGKPCTCAGATYLCWRNVIVAGRYGKSSTSFVAGGLCQLRYQSARHMATSRILKGEKRPQRPGCAVNQVRTGTRSKRQNNSASRSRQSGSAASTR
jgi:hypothetical protein